MKFKALLSPKQIITVKEQTIRACNGEIITDDKNVIKALSENKYWSVEKAEAKKETTKKKAEAKKEEVKEKIKTTGDKK